LLRVVAVVVLVKVLLLEGVVVRAVI